MLLALSDFKCSQDLDIETFLHEHAEEYQNRGLCNVYLVLNEEAFKNGKIKVEAYFTLSHKTLCATSNMTRTRIKKIDGYSTKAQSLHFVLIGQLGKYIFKINEDEYIRSEVTGKEILDYAFEIIYASSELIPCRCVLVECNDKEKVKNVYENYGFEFFQKDDRHNQYFKVLD